MRIWSMEFSCLVGLDVFWSLILLLIVAYIGAGSYGIKRRNYQIYDEARYAQNWREVMISKEAISDFYHC